MINNIDPMQIGRIMAMVPDVSSIDSDAAGRCPAFPGAASRPDVHVPAIGAGVWIEFEQGDPDYPIWTGCFWGSAAEVPAAALLSPPPRAGDHAPDAAAEQPVGSDLPGPTGGILIKSMTGATITVNETGIIIQNGQGASIVMAGTVGHDQRGRPDRGVGRCDMPGLLLHQGAMVMCAHGGRRSRLAPNPRVLVSGMPTVTLSRAVRRRRLRVAAAAGGQRPCVTAQFVTGALRAHQRRAAAADDRQPGDLRPDRHAAAPVTTTRRA